MSANLIDFMCARHKAGYSIEGEVIVPVGQRVKLVAPPENLYLLFAELKPEPEVILDFASRYGLLHAPAFNSAEHYYADEDPHRFAEPLSDWIAAVNEMSRALRVLQDAQRENAAGRIGGGTLDVIGNLNRDLLGDTPLQVRLVNRNPARFALALVPATFHAFIALQFAQALASDQTFRQCRECRRWMQITPTGNGRRSSAATCSLSCRVKFNLKMKSEAQRRRKAGESYKQIETALRAQGWQPASVSKHRGKGSIGQLRTWCRPKSSPTKNRPEN
jgi:hypothetical protein